ncbi:hypothetical protein CRE_24410 [Caenorhabditis remanei]|uniref:F-box domain-containing protein n=1 Tax=Caenorhabditis remanei TaxID=31234 RepID=E3MFU6_CAERE|nr:hypothetical protein CRE_24410 [Caenorhabditis remanei]
MNSSFPLLKLPILVFNTVVSNLNVFELVSLAVCSKRLRFQCKHFRNTAVLKKQIEKFHVEFSTVCRIRIKFYPSLTSELAFQVEKLKEERTKCKNIFEDVYISKVWSPRVNQIAHHEWYPLDEPFVSEYSQSVYYSNCAIPAVSSMVSFLSDLFSVPPTSLCLNFDLFKKEEIDQIMTLYCDRQTADPIKQFEMRDAKKEKEETNTELVISIIARQNATTELKLMFKPSSDFQFDFNSLCKTPEFLEFEYSYWINWEQAINMNSKFILYFLRSNFSNSDFKSLVEKWKSGWTPKWKRIMIESCETLDIDSYIIDPIIDIPMTNSACRSFIEQNDTIHAFKFEMKISFAAGEIIKNGYLISRPDKSIATVAVERNRIGWFIIQPDEPDAKFVASAHERTFYL